jgi:adenosylcobinamide-GDP ribazoletransferase
MTELVKINPVLFCIAIFAAPIIGRLAMVFVISNFPYARPEGIGKAFSKYSTPKIFFTALVETLFLLLPLALMELQIFCTSAVAFMAAIIFSMYFGRYATQKLGGVTGDIYGAVEMLSEVLVIIIFLFAGTLN